MKPTVHEEVQSDEEAGFPSIPLFLSSTSSQESASLAGKGIAIDSGSVDSGKPAAVLQRQQSRGQVAPAPSDETREIGNGRPPLPENTQCQKREDNPKPLSLNRDQSGGTAISALTEISPEGSPVARVHHNRTISWDVNAQFAETHVVVQEDSMPPLWTKREKSTSKKASLSVAELQQTGSPLEAEAETNILKAIEDREMNEPPAAERCVFPEISETMAESFRLASDSAKESLLSHNQSRRGHRRAKTGVTNGGRGSTLESTLLDLTVAMRDMHEQAKDTSKIPDEEDHSARPSLINHANVLFRRSNLSKQPETVGKEEIIDLEMGEGKGSNDTGESNDGEQEKPPRRRARKRMCLKTAEEDWATLSDFLRPRRASLMLRLKSLLLAFILPALTIASILFYGGDNPEFPKGGASISWFILFLVRHSILYVLVSFTQLIFIDFLALNTRWLVRTMGPFPSLCVVQSKGWPFVVTIWGFYGLLTLAGENRFAKHWLYYQDAILMCNEANPAGTITESRMNIAILACAVLLGVVATIKRVALGLHFGRKTYAHFGDDIAKLVQKILLVGEVAALARDLEVGASLYRIQMRAAALKFNVEELDLKNSEDEASGNTAGDAMSFSTIIDKARRDRYTGSITESQRNEMMGLLESWEEPETETKERIDDVSISAILQFRQALVLASNDFPFSMAFGLADTREHCIESSHKVYKRLLLRQSDEGVLDFDTIALLAITDNGDIEHEKMKDLIRLFRPERNGTLTLVDFVKSVDKVYKRLRLLSASVANAAQIDKAAERIFNCIFYTIATIIIIAILGLDPMALFLSISSIIVAFAFMISNASSRWFEGMLFVLARRPYSIGDRIHVSPVDEDTNPNGSSTWYVENVDLFKTTIRFATTNEVATVSNGSLANTRVINAARSPKMLVYVYMKFGVNVSYEKVKVFRKTIETFVHERPRDWLSMCGFRATRVEHELGFIEYVMVLQHRERWQNVVMMLNAKAELSSFANEVAKKLDMPYRAVPLPVDLNMGATIMNRLKDEISAENSLRRERTKTDESDRTRRATVATGSAPDMSDLAALFSTASFA